MTTAAAATGSAAGERPVIAVLAPTIGDEVAASPVNPVFADVVIDRTAGCARCRAGRLLAEFPGAVVALVVAGGDERMVAVAVRESTGGVVRTGRLWTSDRSDDLIALACRLYGRWSLEATDLPGTLGQAESDEDLGGG